MKRLSDIGEDALIERLLNQLSNEAATSNPIIVGPGDDCAVVDIGLEDCFQLLKTDSLVEGVHFLADTPAVKVGWKAIARVISDFAAMGGWSGQLLVTLAMPADKDVKYLEELYQGMQQCASAYGATICGGETSSVPEGSSAVISIAGTGWVEKDSYVTRSGGQVGDRVLVTGRLGGSISGKHLDFKPRMNEAQWLRSHFKIRAMMDVSDGLGQDLPRLAKASGCGCQIDVDQLPCNPGCDSSSALGDGEDYELLLTVDPDCVDDLMLAWDEVFSDLELTDVGELTSQGAIQSDENTAGWQHFQS